MAGLCRHLVRQGVKVAPFKAQNMSNNSVVTPDGGEVGRAQAMQAAACGLEPRVEFNPVLLKPSGESGSQVVVLGKACRHASTRRPTGSAPARCSTPWLPPWPSCAPATTW